MPLLSQSDAAALVHSGMSVGIGGFGLDRKPLALLDSLIQNGVRDLDLQVYAGGLDVERLTAANAVRRIAFTHVGLDQFGLSPSFRRARETARIEAEEWSEWSMMVAWRAAAEHVPFAPVAIDPATELFRVNPSFSRIRCPFGGPETAVVKSPRIEIALLQAEAVHRDGWVVNAGDEYADALLARAAEVTVVCAERLIDDAELQGRWLEVQIIDTVIDHIVLCPGGARPGSCHPLYGVNSEAINSLLGPVRS
jgi:glutaconate CoA-transferase, subunit A